MTHTHTYRTIAFWTLTLPDCDGYYDGFLSWECPCGDVCWATGTFAPDAHAMSPDEWQVVLERERRTRSPLAQSAARTERQHIAPENKYTAFTRRNRRAHTTPRSRQRSSKPAGVVEDTA